MDQPHSRFEPGTDTCFVLMERHSTHMKVKDWLYGVYHSYGDAIQARNDMGDPGDLEIIETFFVPEQFTRK